MEHDPALTAAVKTIADSVKRHGSATMPATEVLHRCGRYHVGSLTPIIALLREHDITVDPGPDQAERWHTLRMQSTPEQPAETPDGEPRGWVLDRDAIREYTPTGEIPEGVVWLDIPHHRCAEILPGLIDGLLARDGEAPLPAEDIAAIVDDLSRPDHRPNRHVFGARTQVRTLSAFDISADESADADVDARDPYADKTGVLELRLVEILVGPTWLVTVRFPSERVDPRRVAGRTDASHSPEMLDIDRLRTSIEKRWVRSCVGGERRTTGDLGILIFHELVDSYPRALRILEAWLTQWELQSIDPDLRTERASLASLRLLLEEFESRIGPLSRPYRDDPVIGWFPQVADEGEAKHVHAIVNDALQEADRQQSRVRAAFDVLEGAEGDRQRQRLERFAGLVAIPAVVTGFLGMNIWLPLNDRPWSFIVALVFMVAVTGLVYALLGDRRYRAGRRRRQ